jgi:hypothetical protein
MIRRRHHFIVIGRSDTANELPLEFPRHDRRCSRFAPFKGGVTLIQAQAALTFLLIGAVALGAVLGQNRLNISLKIRSFGQTTP